MSLRSAQSHGGIAALYRMRLPRRPGRVYLAASRSGMFYSHSGLYCNYLHFRNRQ